MNKAEKGAVIALPIILAIAYGVGIAGSQNGNSALNMPLFMLAAIVAFVGQWIGFIPSYLKRTEKFFDLMGTIGFLSTILLALLLSSEIDTRSILLTVLISIWSIRLGLFLFNRIHKAGEDDRFREIKQSFPRFLMTWSLQALWIVFSLAAALAAITANEKVEIEFFAIIGTIIWLFGFLVEVVADYQKSKFKANPENKGKFISTGLWSWSRHPNYFGEITLWIGIAIIAAPVLVGWQWVSMISPVFITLLLTKVSGVPLLEKKADEKWGDQQDYENYKKTTSVLILRPPTS